ncbi:DJ-1/PfpI family protein [Bacterioplanoides sp.]|uniref:DJ-1/PfpI family protein n=1 Tax=Bacterioplanoides sp. TaxID=2066072 RepID=UPI003B007B98
MNVGIFIYDQAEVLDFAGPFEVFSTANRLATPTPFNVFLVAEQAQTINARGGLSVVPHYSFQNHPDIDVLIVVGGVHTEVLTKPEVISWVANTAANTTYVASVCTGVFILAEAGVVTNQTVTTHWEDIGELQQNYPGLTVVDGRRWVDQGKIISSGGISAGIDMSLHLVERLTNLTLAEKTARQMEFDWRKESN